MLRNNIRPRPKCACANKSKSKKVVAPDFPESVKVVVEEKGEEEVKTEEPKKKTRKMDRYKWIAEHRDPLVSFRRHVGLGGFLSR